MKDCENRPARFLLVEDNPDHAELFLQLMVEHHMAHLIHLISSGDEVLPYLRRMPPYQAVQKPDVILLDLKLPGLSGHEIMELIKADPDLKSIPVVVMTSSDAARDRERAAKAQANGYLVKPIDFDEFQKTVQDLEEMGFAIH